MSRIFKGMDREKDIETAAWVEAAQRGDREAFGRLVERYQGMVYAQCRRLAPNRADAEDWAHDALVQAFTQIRQLQDGARFGGWLKRIVLNICRSHWRRQYAERVPLTAASATASMADDELWGEVEDNLWRLSLAQRLVLALHYWEGLSYDEIAHFIGVPVGTVMSRLYRARQNLKDGLDKKSEDEMDQQLGLGAAGPDLKREIDAEIEALGRLFAEDPASMERLSVLLRHAPARFGRLIEEMKSDETDSLVLLLKRLGAPAMGVALDCYFGGEGPVRQRALALLVALVAQDQDWHWDKDWSKTETLAHATQTTYALLDGIIARAVSDAEKVELLLELAGAAKPCLVRWLCQKVMLGYPEAAYALLLQRLEAGVEGTVQSPPLEMRIFCLFGGRMARRLVEWLDAGDEARQRLGWIGLAALSEQLNPGYMMAEGAVEAERADPRFRDSWHLVSQDLGADLLDGLAVRVQDLSASPQGEARMAAIRLLGALRRRDAGAVEALGRCLAHLERPTRIMALHALGEVAHENVATDELAALHEPVARLAAAADRGEQVAALAALGRLKVAAARPLLTETARTASHAEVREAAVNGLGQIGGDESLALLRRLQTSGSKDLRKKASRWLQRLAPRAAAPSPTQAARQKRLARFRGDQAEDTVFPTHRFHINLGGAIRSLPAVRDYPEMELTRYFAQVCRDYSFTRRVLADRGLLHREEGICRLTEAGQAVWRVEHFIRQRYLGR